MSVELKSANFSNCNRYRYNLVRIWDNSLPQVGFIGLNPSTADHQKDDPTIRRCRNFAKSWGYGGMVMVNLFAYRATKPNDMMSVSIPVGELNNRFIIHASRQCEKMVACWGTLGSHIGRDIAVTKLLNDLYCIKKTKNGFPSHPLYLKSDSEIQVYTRHNTTKPRS